MKTFVTLAAVMGMTLADEDLQACMYCKRADIKSGYMHSFSYCGDPDEQKCILNSWQYIDQALLCETDLIDGWLLDIDVDCEAELAPVSSCPASFVSTIEEIDDAVPVKNVALSENTKCTMVIDATEAVARVTISGNPYVGVMLPDYEIGQLLTVP